MSWACSKTLNRSVDHVLFFFQAGKLMYQVLTPEGKIKTKEYQIGLNELELVKLYRGMLRVRVIDEKLLNLQRQGRIGFYASCTGQEAAAVASGFAMEKTDWIFPAHREGGVALLRGWPLTKYVAQVMGKTQDVQKGRQMPCHYSDSAVHHVSWSSCVGTQLPHAVGAAWAMKIRGDKHVCMAYLGDGASSQGDFHAALNFACVFQARVVFFCQNNQWSISVPFNSQTASESIAIKATAYGCEGIQVDGNDVLAVLEVCSQAVDKARSGGGPTLIEAITYRIGAHSTSDDPNRYRDQSVTERWKHKDPIRRFEAFLLNEQVLTEESIQECLVEFKEEITAVIQEVENSPPPSQGTLFEDVYTELPWHLEEQRAQFLESL